jgi:hypothetical protein
MLSPHEFSVGCISDATGLTLVLPRGNYETSFIVNAAVEPKIAVVLEGDHRFLSFECSDNTSWKGLIVPNILIEVDETSVVDTVPLGAVVRSGTTLAIRVKWDGGMGNRTVPLITELTPCRDDLAAAFTRWSIIIGEGLSRRELMAVEIS